MRVTPADHGHFWVTSADDQDPYLVDVTANEGRMLCSCRDFQCRRQPLLNKGIPAIVRGLDKSVCKHCEAVILYLGQHGQAALAGKKRTQIWRDDI